jgi:hypothetical protein
VKAVNGYVWILIATGCDWIHGWVEKVGEVTWQGTISYTQSRLTLHRKEKEPHLARLGHLCHP